MLRGNAVAELALEVGTSRVGAGFYLVLMVLWVFLIIPLCAVRANGTNAARSTAAVLTMISLSFMGMAVIFGLAVPLAGLHTFWTEASRSHRRRAGQARAWSGLGVGRHLTLCSRPHPSCQIITGYMRGALVCALATFAAGFLVFARSSHDALRDGAAHALQHIGVHLTR